MLPTTLHHIITKYYNIALELKNEDIIMISSKLFLYLLPMQWHEYIILV